MTALEANASNSEQIQFWNETAAPKWLAFQDVLDVQIGPLGRCAMERATVRTGERVVDVGCGCGDTTLELARRVGAAGHVTAVDVSAPMLARARERAATASLGNTRFMLADVQAHTFEAAAFDLVFSRFGVMFFADPTRAFANLAAALRSGGRAAFVCWQPPERNPWVMVPAMAAAQHIAMPPRPAPDAPGPFSFADPARLRRILVGAGFAEPDIEPLEETLTVAGGELDRAVELLLEVGPTAAALRDSPPEARPLVAAAVRTAIKPFVTSEGVRMPSAAWVVSARVQR